MNAVLELIPAGRFIATPATIGSTHAELEAWSRGELAQERAMVIDANLREAAVKLNCRPAEGWC